MQFFLWGGESKHSMSVYGVDMVCLSPVGYGVKQSAPTKG